MKRGEARETHEPERSVLVIDRDERCAAIASDRGQSRRHLGAIDRIAELREKRSDWSSLRILKKQ